MGFLDKAKDVASDSLEKGKELSGKASEKMRAFDSDAIIADTVLKAVEKQEKVVVEKENKQAGKAAWLLGDQRLFGTVHEAIDGHKKQD